MRRLHLKCAECFSSDSALYITWKSLNSDYSALISAEKSIFQSSTISAELRCFSADFRWNSSAQRWFFVALVWNFSVQFSTFFSKHFEVPHARGTKFRFLAQLVNRMNPRKFSSSIFSQAKDISKTRNFGFPNRKTPGVKIKIFCLDYICIQYLVWIPVRTAEFSSSDQRWISLWLQPGLIRL